MEGGVLTFVIRIHDVDFHDNEKQDWKSVFFGAHCHTSRHITWIIVALILSDVIVAQQFQQ
jgi:hypothetical protein